MNICEFLDRISWTDDYVKTAFSEDDIRKLAFDSDNQESAQLLQMLFCCAKVAIDPSPEVRDLQDRMKSKGAPVERIVENSLLIQLSDYPNEWSVQEAIMNGLEHKDASLKSGKDCGISDSLEEGYLIAEA